MLAGDYPCAENVAKNGKDEPFCKLCKSLNKYVQPFPIEDLAHMLTRCRATLDTRSHLIPNVYNVVATYYPRNSLLLQANDEVMTQFLLDCTSLNLPNDIRLSSTHYGFEAITKQCSYFISAVHKDRTKQLSLL